MGRDRGRSHRRQPAAWRRVAGDLEPVHGPARTVPSGAVYPASILRCPVVLIFALRQQARPAQRAVCRPADPAARERQQALQATVDRYAQRLEHYALMSPLDWFNFSISGICQSPERRVKGADRSPLYD